MSEILKQAEFDPTIRQEDDISTWLAEILPGSMNNPVPYWYDGNDLRARDGGEVKPIFDKALKQTETLVNNNPNLSFELRRREIEMGEYEDMIAMAKGEGPNTMVVVSDFPPELMDATQDVGGYSVTRKQTMMRVISRRKDGLITMVSQSLDGSNRRALETIYDFMGEPVKYGELLGQRIKRDLDETFQNDLTNVLIRVYDSSLSTQHGGEWYAGRQPADKRNTYDFVNAQKDLISVFLAGSQDEEAQFNLAAAMEARFEGNAITAKRENLSYISVVVEMEIAGRNAQAANKMYSGCGASIGKKTAEEELAELGFGNKSKEELSWHGGKIKKGKCVNCNEGPKEVGVKDWCKDCISGHCG